MGGLLFYGALDFPIWGDPQSPASSHLSPYYIEHTMSDTSVPNIVTSVLADYRGYDTMFETVVIFTAGIISFFLLRTFKKPRLIQDCTGISQRELHCGLKKGVRYRMNPINLSVLTLCGYLMI